MGLFKKKISKNKKNAIGKNLPLLQVFLSTMPKSTQIKQSSRFANVKANFEFGTWIPVPLVDRLINDAMNKGFVVWSNSDANSAFLYGAGRIAKNKQVNIIIWLQKITQPGQKGQIMIKHTIPAPRLIKFDSSRTSRN